MLFSVFWEHLRKLQNKDRCFFYKKKNSQTKGGGWGGELVQLPRPRP